VRAGGPESPNPAGLGEIVDDDSVQLLADALQALNGAPSLCRASDWPGSLAGLDQPGLYAWWVDESGAAALGAGLGIPVPAGRVYVGQAGAASSRTAIPSRSTLRRRIGRSHLGGKVRGSTLRRTLASILLAPLSLELLAPKQLSADSEAVLSAWMSRHLSLAVHAAASGEQLAALEKQVVDALRPPLNVDHMPAGVLRARLLELRAVVVHGIDDLWLPPDPSLTDWRSILAEYGQAFDGYRYAEVALGRECSAVADRVWGRLEGGSQASSFAELRCTLFWLQRCVHSAEQSPGWQPSAELTGRVHRLYAAIQEAWRRERFARQATLPKSKRTLPSQADLERAAEDFDGDWGGVDEVLYGICRAHPGHAVRREVTAKIALIDRAYSAGLERRVTPPPGQQAISVIAQFVIANAGRIDGIIESIRPLREPLTSSVMAEIVAQHGRLTSLLQKVTTDGKAPRSFAAKYLHFHCPIVPIYDSYAAARLTRLVRWDAIGKALFEPPPEGDPDYWDFCVRFLHLYEACRHAGLAVSVKGLDTYLWAVPGDK
jgi:hypothetical protein